MSRSHINLRDLVLIPNLLVQIEPHNFVDDCGITVTGGTGFEVDWGDGIFIPYPPGSAWPIVPTGNITVISNDATKIAFTTKTYNTIDILNGISLTDLSYVCTDHYTLTSFTMANTPNVTSLSSAFFNTPVLATFGISDPSDTGNVQNFEAAWNGSHSLVSLPVMDTSSGTNFGWAIDGNLLTCIGAIDTTSATTTTAMFGGSPLVAPNGAEQTLLETIPPGYSYINPGACP